MANHVGVTVTQPVYTAKQRKVIACPVPDCDARCGTLIVSTPESLIPMRSYTTIVDVQLHFAGLLLVSSGKRISSLPSAQSGLFTVCSATLWCVTGRKGRRERHGSDGLQVIDICSYCPLHMSHRHVLISRRPTIGGCGVSRRPFSGPSRLARNLAANSKPAIPRSDHRSA